MSQEKVDKYKKQKYNRKHQRKKTNVKKIASYAIATLIVVAFIVYIGYSVLVTTGIYERPTTAAHVEMSDEELESLRNVLIENGDPNVQTEAATDEETTAAETTAEETTAEETTAE